MEAENNMEIYLTLERFNKTDRTKLPLADCGRVPPSPKELCKAVSNHVKNFTALCREPDCTLKTIKKVLNFLYLMGVDDAYIAQEGIENNDISSSAGN